MDKRNLTTVILAQCHGQVQGQESYPVPEAEDVVSSELNAHETCATADPQPPSYFDGQASSKQDAHAEHDDCRGHYNQGTFTSRVSGFCNCGGGMTKAQVTCTRSRSASEKVLKKLPEHKKEIFYRLRLALCFARKKHLSGGKRVIDVPAGTPCRTLSYINSKGSAESDNISIKSTVCGESVDQTPPAQLDAKYGKKTGSQENQKSRRGRKPRKLFIDNFGGSDGQVKTTFKTEVRRGHASKARPTISGRTPNISTKVELRRRLRSDTRKDRKRLVKNSCCALCGDVKYTPPPSKNLARILNHRSRAGRPSPTALQKGACHNSESHRPPTTPILRFEKNLMVKLCDVARVFDIASRDFSCVLPAVLRQKRKRKRVRCSMKEFSFLLQPPLHGISKQRSKIANQSWEVSTPTHSCASFSSGDPPSGATGSTYISDTAETPDGSVKKWDACLVRNPDCERMRQTDIEGTASVLPRCEDSSPVVRFCEKDKACPMNNISESPSSPVRRVPPLILRRVTVNGFVFRHDNENRGLSLDEEEEDRRNEDSDCEVNSPESFSCQRTQAYIFFPQSSCARTCKIWPFPRMGPPNEIRPSHLTGPRWIVTTPFPATVQTSHGVAPECLSDKDVQNKLSKPTKQSKSSHDERGALEGQLLSSAPGEKPPIDMLAVLEKTSKNPAQSLYSPRGTMTQDIFHISKLAEHTTYCAFGEKPPTCTPERAWKCLVDSPRVVFSHVSKPAELESNQSLKKAFEDVLEYSAPVMTEQGNNYKLNGLDYAASLEGNGILKKHSLLKKSNKEMLSSGSNNQSDVPVIREEDTKLRKDSLNPKAVSRDGVENCGRRVLYNPGSLSQICLKVKMLKAQHSSLVTTTSSVEQETKSVTPNSVGHTPDSNPDFSGEGKRTQVFDTSSITDSSSEDENKNFTSLSSEEESLKRHAAESLLSDDDGTCQIKDKEQGSTLPPFPVIADSFLDVSRAYEEDVLILDVIQDDPELFGAVVTETVSNKDASTQENENEKTQQKSESKLQTGNPCKIVWDLNSDRTSEPHPTAVDAKMEDLKDGGTIMVKETQSYLAQPPQCMNTLKSEHATDCNNQEMRETNNLSAITVKNTRATSLVMNTCGNGVEVTAKETSALRNVNSSYCWYHFSEYSTCLRSVCWFLHTPRDGDEKFCMDIVKKFCHVGKRGLILRADHQQPKQTNTNWKKLTN
ncbi:protein TOPAZ1 [Pimephales promelas]|nr:protein TOPAZ1 [Pimephales promelas]